MSLNFKLLRRSFSLRNNVTDDRQNENTSNRHQEFTWTNEINSAARSAEDSDKNKISYISASPYNRNMEFLMPYTLHKQPITTGMQLVHVKKQDNKVTSNTLNMPTTITTVTESLPDCKKHQKQESNQQQKLLKSSFDADFPPRKMSKKQVKLAQEQLKKLTKINIHLHALFSAVENNHFEKTKSILESTNVDVNCLNVDALSPLDVAVLNNNRSLTKILLQHGAMHGANFKNSDLLEKHLHSLLYGAINRIHELRVVTKDDSDDHDAEKNIDLLQRRANGIRHKMHGWLQTFVPHSPCCVVVEVTSSNSVSIKIQESSDGAITTKFKIQWSISAVFNTKTITGEEEIHDLTNYQGAMSSIFHLNNLIQGQRYFIRASSGNVKGWSEYCLSSPNSIIPSGWRDVENKKFPTDNKQLLEDLITNIRSHRVHNAFETQLDRPLNEISTKKKATIRQLFSATSKFQYNLKRGIYLACVLHHEGKVLVTNDDFLPVIEIDENYPNNLHTEYQWLLKVTCNWDIVQSLKNDMERNPTSVNQFRTKLLSAICQMQSSIGIKDLGNFYYTQLKDSKGTIVLSCVNNIRFPKRISVLNSRWITLRKVQRKLMPLNGYSSINEIVLASIQNQIDFYQSSSTKLPKGLYIGYLKMQCSMDQIHIVVPRTTPNVLPHCKIRENPHICAEEWNLLRRTNSLNKPSEIQKRFVDAFVDATRRIFKYMGAPAEHIPAHKVYNVEVIEISNEVNFLIICPPVDLSCSAPGEREMLLQRDDLISMPIQLFERIQLFTYNNDMIQSCSRLSIFLELDLAKANHCLREAFSCIEMQAAKEHLSKVEGFFKQLSEIWKNIRWLVDVMSFARNRCPMSGIRIRDILEMDPLNSHKSVTNSILALLKTKQNLFAPLSSNRNLLTRRSPYTTSWPNSYRSGLLAIEHSKSDQQLNFIMSNMRSKCFKQAYEFDCSRRNSADSSYPHGFNSSDEAIDLYVKHLSLSKSDSTLTVTKQLSPTILRKRSKTVNANMSSPNFLRYDRNVVKKETSDQSLSPNHESQLAKSKGNMKTTMFSTTNIVHRDQSNIRMSKEIHKIKDDIDKNHLKKENEIEKISKVIKDSSCQFGIIHVFVAFDIGLTKGAHLKLHVTTATTAREIIDLVVKQLNMNVLLNCKNEPIMCNLREFCLVAVIGARERCLTDDFRPLQLQNPWKKGRLYVRKIHDLFAAINTNRQVHEI